MDVKNNKNRRLMEKLKLETLDDFRNLVTMLQASKEDFEVAIKIIENLNVDPIFHALFMKCLTFNKRSEYSSHFFEHVYQTKDKKRNFFIDYKELELKELYIKVKILNNQLCKDIFDHVMKTLLNETFEDYDFIDSEKTKMTIKW
jgi:hypothetical protein